MKTFALELPAGARAASVGVSLNGQDMAATFVQTGSKVVITFTDEVRVGAGQAVALTIHHAG